MYPSKSSFSEMSPLILIYGKYIMNFVFGEVEIWFSGQENASHDFLCKEHNVYYQ